MVKGTLFLSPPVDDVVPLKLYFTTGISKKSSKLPQCSSKGLLGRLCIRVSDEEMAEQLVRLSTRPAEARLSLCFHSAFLSCCKTRRSGHGAQSTCWSLSAGLKRGTGRRRDADCSAVAESQIQGVSTIPGAQQCGGERCLPPLTPTPEKHIRPHLNEKKSTGRNRVQLRPQTVILGVPFERCLSHFVCFTLTSVCCRFLAPLVGVK